MIILNTQELNAARDWIKDCLDCFSDLECTDDVDQLTDIQVMRGIKRHYNGGLDQFKIDGAL